MKNKKAIIGLGALAVMLFGVATSIAYLTDTDTTVNVMTVGNVKIAQLEYERVVDANGNATTELKTFTQAKEAVPAVYKTSTKTEQWADELFDWSSVGAQGKTKVFHKDMKNVIDKFVLVENTGKKDAYVRTIIAIEEPAELTVDYDRIHINSNTTDYEYKVRGSIEIEGVRYAVLEYTYKEALAAGEKSAPSLAQVFLDPKTTSEEVELFGSTFEILAISQAVQTDGFDTAEEALDEAFGKTSEKAAEWFKGIPRGFKVSNNKELADAIAKGETEIYLNPSEEPYHMPEAAKGKTLIINGTNDSIIEVVPAGQGEANGQLDYSLDGSTVTFNGVTIKTNSQLYAGFARLSATYNDCVIQNTYNLGVGTSVFNNCVFNITNEYLRVGGAYSAKFNNCVFNTDGRAILVFQDGTTNDQTVTVKDCTFNATAAAQTWNGIHVAAVSIDGTNGKYTVNLEGTNTVDSDFNGLWQIKTGEANVTVNE